MSDIDATQAGKQALWFLERACRPDPITDEEIAGRVDASQWDGGWTPAGELNEMRERLGGAYTVESATEASATQVEIVVTGGDGRRWAFACGVDDDGRATNLWLRPAPPPGTVIRDAVPEDAAALAELERNVPLRLGELRVAYDRGDDYFASARLMEDVAILVALVDGVHAGVYWGARQRVRIGGHERTLLLEHHVRVLPEFQRGGVFWTLVSSVRDRIAPTVDSIAFYISPRNERMQRHVADVPSWSAKPVRMLLDCAAVAGAGGGRPATATDADVVAGILNGCRGGEELYVPYTRESLTARLGRAPSQYGWEHLRMSDGAVVGVCSDLMRMTFSDDSGSRESLRATALDHGFAPGAEDEYRTLIGGWCAELAGRGFTELAVFTSQGSATYRLLADLATDTEPFDFWTFDLDEPHGAPERGIYVDPVYF